MRARPATDRRSPPRRSPRKLAAWQRICRRCSDFGAGFGSFAARSARVLSQVRAPDPCRNGSREELRHATTTRFARPTAASTTSPPAGTTASRCSRTSEDRERFYDLLDTGIAANDVECHQDVQMGNHVHLLLEGDDGGRVDAAVVRQPPVRARIQPAPRPDQPPPRPAVPLVEVPDAYAARAVCVYIAMNPVRAGLCRAPAGLGSSARIRRTRRRRAAAAAPRARTSRTRSSPAARTTVRGRDRCSRRARAGRQAAAGGDPAAARTARRRSTSGTPRQIYGYTVPEIAAHYRRSARSIGAMAR